MINDENTPHNTDDFQEINNNNLIYEGHSFSRKNTAKGHTLYWCKYSRSQDCPVKLKKFTDYQIFTDNRIITSEGLHSEGF